MKKFLSMLVAVLASISISASNGFTVSSVSSISSGKKIMLWTDLHVMNPALLVNAGNAWQNYLASDRKMVDKSWEIFDGMVDFALAEKPDMLLVAGDLTKDGEKQSHVYVATGLQKLVDAGIQVYVIPGNHDRGTDSNAVA
jgi:DNA repair exonuclease SbcCD nuclease subunit